MNGWNPRRVKALMMLKSMKRRDLASKCGIAESSLTNVLANSRVHYVSQELIGKIADALDTTPEYLTEKTDDPDPNKRMVG